MEREHERVMMEFLRESEMAGQSLTRLKYALKIFFRYCESEELSYDRVGIREAEEFQRSLFTDVREDGNIRYGRNTVVGILGSCAAMYAHLLRRRKVVANPFKDMDRLKTERILPRDVPGEDEMERVLAYLRKWTEGETVTEKRRRYKAHVVAELMYSTGCRIHEAAGMAVDDVDLDRGMVRIHDRKTKTQRYGFLNDYAREVLGHYLRTMREKVNFRKNGADTALVFEARHNLDVWFNLVLKDVAHSLGKGRYTSHMFRHAFGCHFLRRGCDIRYIQHFLGHENLSSTQVYTKVEKEDLREVIDSFHPRGKLHGAKRE